MKKKVLSLLLVLVLLVTAMAVMTQAEETLPAGGAIMVAHDGEEIVQEDPAAAWATGEYAYVKLYGATDAFAEMTGEKEIPDGRLLRGIFADRKRRRNGAFILR